MNVQVEIREPVAGTSRTLQFSSSPVRIGRNQLNDIPLEDPFVSDWHGIIRFDERSIAYFDLGSTNGTLLDGQRLVKNVPAELSEKSRLQLGRLELVVVHRPVEPAPPPAKTTTGPHKTLGWGRFDAAPLTPVPPSAGPALGKVRLDAALPVGANRRGLAELDPAQGLPPVPGVTPATPTARGEPPWGRVSDRAGASGSFAPGDDSYDGTAALLARQQKLLEAFSEAFVGLRKGYEQFGAQVGVRTINGSTPLHRARTSREVLDYLLKPGVDPVAAARDLIAIFADFGIHHIAMMEGVTEGVRAVLQSLDPRANDLDTGPRLWPNSKTKTQWKAYLESFDRVVTEDEELHAAIFGEEFARAYASVTLGDGRKTSERESE